MDPRNILKMRLSLAIVFTLLIFLPFAPSSGNVFWKRLTTKTSSIFDKAGNWTQIYRSPMIINGARASLSVYGSEDSLRSVTAKLKQSFSANKNNHLADPGFAGAINENSARFLYTSKKQISRLLIQRMPGRDQSVIFELIQPKGELSKPPVLLSESAVFGRSFPAGCSLTTTIKNKETGALLETLTSSLPPGQAFNDISEYLSNNGWNGISPDADKETSRTYFRIYQRNDFLCIVMVSHSLPKNITCVTILSKEINRH